jgi:hypothetical protein
MQPNHTWGCRLAWSRLVDLGSIDSGSNPGSPTTIVLFSVDSKLFVEFFDENVSLDVLNGFRAKLIPNYSPLFAEFARP